ncbi:MAG: hypothetical protein CMF56_02145 [Leifsonia sp.]|nr:hypothetical protein [Leifsonia sp.]|tara:strand:+ start:128860 stop:130785 length:1926 start_codon:yes stop_codon:yes gene_type:complete
MSRTQRRIRRVAGVLAVLAAVLIPAASASAAPTARADVDDFEIASFDAVYTLGRDGEGFATLDVVETIVAVFPDIDQNKGFYRDIPEYYGNVQLHTAVLSVTDDDGDAVPYFTEYYEDFYSIGLGDDSYVHGEQTYVIHYEQRNTIRYFADAEVDEFQWDVNGTGWAQPFGRVSAELRVDPGLVDSIVGDAFCAAGAFGATGCPGGITREDDAETGEAVFRATAGPFAPYENLTIAVAFAGHTFAEGPTTYPPSSYDDDYGPSTPPPRAPWWMEMALFLVGPLGVLVGIIARMTRKKDLAAETAASDIIVPQYTPPRENIMLAAHIAGRPDRAFAAQLVDLAVRRKIRLLDPGTAGGDEYSAELVTAEGVDRHERALLVGIFGGGLEPGSRFALSSSSKTLSAAFHRGQTAITEEITSQGYAAGTRLRPLSAGLMLAGTGVAIGAVALVTASAPYSGSEGAFIGVLAAGWGALQTFSHSSSRRVLTSKGEKLNDYLLGMKDYLELAEKDRFAMLQSVTGADRIRVDDQTELVKLYEKLLPWAVLWGVERSWGEVLVAAAAEARTPIEWMSSRDQLTGWRLYSIVSSVSRSTPAPPVVARSRSTGFTSGGGWSSSGGSSSSSFSSGGGFSGGGGGGGGGRGR